MSEHCDTKPAVEILVIDDDTIMRELMTDWLEAAGYAVRKACDCTTAVAEMQRGAPALVVSDMWMPGPCGAEAIHSMREKHPGLRVIAVSGHFNSDQGCSAQEALQAGAARALAKPGKRADLLRAVAELVGPAKS